jgi:ribosomal protein S18 acetylase RimI-like enzyme
MSARMPLLSEAERIDVIEEATRVCSSVENGAFCADNFLVCEGSDRKLLAGLVTFTDREFPHTWDILSKRLNAVLEKKSGKEAVAHSELVVAAINSGWYLLKEQEDTFHIDLIYVVPEARGSPVLSELLNEACATARQRGVKAAEISLMTENIRAKRAYEKRGFEEYFSFSFPSIQKFVATKGFTLLRKVL